MQLVFKIVKKCIFEKLCFSFAEAKFRFFPGVKSIVGDKVYKDDPLVYPKCSGSMRMVEFVEKSLEVKKILNSLNLWEMPRNKRAPPKNTL